MRQRCQVKLSTPNFSLWYQYIVKAICDEKIKNHQLENTGNVRPVLVSYSRPSMISSYNKYRGRASRRAGGQTDWQRDGD